MKKFYFILLFSFSILQQSFSVELIHPIKKDTSNHNKIIFSIGGGFIYTSLNFFKNYQEDTYYRGFGGRVLVQFTDVLRLSIGREQVNSVDIQPIWLHVNNTYYDVDLHFISHFSKSKNTCYYILGVSTQYWNGFYTGINDFDAWKLNIPRNSFYHALYFGVTIGVGAEIKLAGPLNLFGEFKFRVSKTDLGSGLSDVLYSAGLKLNLPTFKSKTGNHHSKLKFGDKYHWF